GAIELLVVPGPAGVLGDPDVDQDLAVADRGGEQVFEEVTGRDLPPPVGAGDRHHGVEGQGGGEQVPGGVGVGERAAEGAAVSDLRVGHGGGGLGQQSRMLAHQRVVHHVVVRGHGADDERIPV